MTKVTGVRAPPRKGYYERDLAMINFMLDSGVRVSEMCSIKLKDVDFKNYTAKVMGKGRKERVVSYTGETAVRINEYLKTRKDISFDGGRMMYQCDAPLFSSLKSPYNHLCKGGAEQILKKIGYRCDIQRIHPHLLRATCATKLSKNGVDIGYIAKYLGHANLDSIDRYVLINDTLLNNKIRNIGLVS